MKSKMLRLVYSERLRFNVRLYLGVKGRSDLVPYDLGVTFTGEEVEGDEFELLLIPNDTTVAHAYITLADPVIKEVPYKPIGKR